MPHRTTYFFPRQFPDRSSDDSAAASSSGERLWSHEEMKSSRDRESDVHVKGNVVGDISSNTKPSQSADLLFTGENNTSSNGTRGKKHVSTLHNWLVERKGETSRHVKSGFDIDGDREMLLQQQQPDPVPVPMPLRYLDRQGSLQRCSSGSSSYAGSLFSGETTTNFTVDSVKDSTASFPSPREEKGGVAEIGQGLGQKAKESYVLQLMLAKRLTSQATALIVQHAESTTEDTDDVNADAETVSYRLWMSGCLSYSDKISDGFYSILGMNPYMWMICNDLDEGSRLPSLMSLRAVQTRESSMEVVLVDGGGDLRLKELEVKAREMYCASESTFVLVEKLGKLVAIYMGGSFPMEQGDLQARWKTVGNRLKEFQKSVVVPIGNLSTGLCRHRAILFKKLADYIGLPCRIARGCKYCESDHRSSCLVKFEDEKHTSREYVVDLVGEPGNVHGPDSSINGYLLSPVPSPFQTSHLRAFRQPCTDNSSSSLIVNSNHIWVPDSLLPSGGGQRVYNPIDRRTVRTTSVDENFGMASSLSLHRCSPLKGRKFDVEQTSKKEIVLSQNSTINNVVSQPKVNLAIHLEPNKVDSRLESRSKFSDVTLPRYLNLEPSLAMDWLEISWEELHIKERVGAGSFGTVHRAEWHGSDVAVKVLTVQDFHDDQLKEFLREVAIMKRVRHPNLVLFMGAVTKRPHFSIVTEYLPRGSLYRIIHRPAAGETMDQRRRLRMALDVAKGINYLHCLNPPLCTGISNLLIYWLIKTGRLRYVILGCPDSNQILSYHPNLLLEQDVYLVPIRLSLQPEWMAPEFLRGEPSDEKSDVYSFGVILWELVTMQQPWSGLGPVQVVGAVAFQKRRLVIPQNTPAPLASLMESCWADNPAQRPSFASIVVTLKKLLKSPTQSIQAEAVPLKNQSRLSVVHLPSVKDEYFLE